MKFSARAKHHITFAHQKSQILRKIRNIRKTRETRKSRKIQQSPGIAALCGLFPKTKEKRPATSYSRMGGSHTTLGEGALDFRVRHGNGYDNSSMITDLKRSEVWRLKRFATPIKDKSFYYLTYSEVSLVCGNILRSRCCLDCYRMLRK